MSSSSVATHTGSTLPRLPLPRLELMWYHLEKKQIFSLAAPLGISLGLLKILAVWSFTPQKQHAVSFFSWRKTLRYPYDVKEDQEKKKCVPKLNWLVHGKKNEEWSHEHHPGNILLLAHMPSTVSADAKWSLFRQKSRRCRRIRIYNAWSYLSPTHKTQLVGINT